MLYHVAQVVNSGDIHADCWCSEMDEVGPLGASMCSQLLCSSCDPVGWRWSLATYGVLRCRVSPGAASAGITLRALRPLGRPERRVDAPYDVLDQRLLAEKEAVTMRGDCIFHADESHRQGSRRLTALACARGGDATSIRFLGMHVGRLHSYVDRLVDAMGFHEKRYVPGRGRQQCARIRRAVHPLVIEHGVDNALFFFPSPATLRAVSPSAAAPVLRRAWSDMCDDETRHSVHWWRPGDLLVWDNVAVVHRSDTQSQRGDRLMYRTFTAGHRCESFACLGVGRMTPICLGDERAP
jgi:hypothetical protein